MIPSTLQKILGTKIAVVAVGCVLAAGAGVAGAAAADLGPWEPDAPEVTNPPVTSEATTTTLEVTTTLESTTTVAPEPTEPKSTEPPATEPKPTEPPATEPPRTEPPRTEPPRTTEPRSTEPPTTEKRPETSVPQGIELACAVEPERVVCEWHGGVVDGFARFLVLRSDGRVVFDTAKPDVHVYIDQLPEPGSYSYVVISVNGDNKNLSHSNKVTLQIGDGI